MRHARALALLAFATACGKPAPKIHVVATFPSDDLVQSGHVALPSGWYAPFLPQRALTRDAKTVLEGWKGAYAELDGLSRLAPLYVKLDGDIDTAKLASLAGADREVSWDAATRVIKIAPTTREDGADFTVSFKGLGGAKGELIVPDHVTLTRFGHPGALLAQVAQALATVTPAPDFSDPANPGVQRVYARGTADYDALFQAAGSTAPDCAIAGVGTFPAHELNADGSLVWDPARAADPLHAPIQNLEFRFALPDGAGPHPFVAVAHGINGSNEYVLHVAEEFCKQGLAVIGISAASQGERGSVTKMFDLTDLRGARDAFRQTAVDVLQLVRLAQSAQFDVDGAAGPDLDAARPAFFGNSFGSIMGADYLAVEPLKPPAVLNVPGSHITRLIGPQSAMHAIFAALAASSMSIPSDVQEEALSFLLGAAQPLVDAGDPASYATPQVGDRVLAQMGVGDQTIPNAVTEELGALLGLGAAPATRALYPVDTTQYSTFPAGGNPHDMYGYIPGLRRQAASYLALRGGAVCEPSACP